MTAPKTNSARRRRNSTQTSTLYAVDPDSVSIPPLPPRRPWLTETRERWEGWFTSPMAAEFVEADYYNLYDLAELCDDFLLAKTSKERIELSKEIRIKGQSFGLTPLDRRRLSWEIEKGERAETQTRARRNRVVEVVPDDEDAYAALK